MLRNFLLTGLVFVLSGALLAITLQRLDPLGPSKNVAFFVFFLSLFFGIGSFFTFVAFFASELFSGRKLGSRAFVIALRRGMFVAVFVTLALALQLFRLLGLFEITLLALFLILIEYALVGKKN